MESWLDTIKRNNKVFLNSFKEDDWRPSNWENIQNNPHCEDYKNLFVKLRFDGHIHDNLYFDVLRRFEKKYTQDKELQNKINRYLEITKMNYTPVNKKNWRNPLGGIYSCGPKIFGISLCCEYRDTELGKEYKKLELELKEIFRNI